MGPEFSFDIGTLQAGFRAGLDPREVVAEVYRRIALAADPAIFITLRPEAEVGQKSRRCPV